MMLENKASLVDVTPLFLLDELGQPNAFFVCSPKGYFFLKRIREHEEGLCDIQVDNPQYKGREVTGLQK